jgi:hypothetical protein
MRFVFSYNGSPNTGVVEIDCAQGVNYVVSTNLGLTLNQNDTVGVSVENTTESGTTLNVFTITGSVVQL